MAELPPIDSYEPEEKFDFNSPEDVLIEIVGSKAGSTNWDDWSIESCTIIKSSDTVTGAASYEQAYGGFLDYTIKEIADCPGKEGWFVVEGITGEYTKGECNYSDDNMTFECKGIRPATAEEIANG